LKENQVFQVRGFFFVWFLSGFRKTSKRLVFFRLFTFVMADKVEVLLYSFTDCGFYSEEDLQTYLLNIYFAVWFGNVLLWWKKLAIPSDSAQAEVRHERIRKIRFFSHNSFWKLHTDFKEIIFGVSGSGFELGSL
jgi:hypothetical protein